VNGIAKLKKVIGKMNILIEKVEWRSADLRSNEIDIAHEHLRKVLKEFEEALYHR
jgi:hypothetical protein